MTKKPTVCIHTDDDGYVKVLESRNDPGFTILEVGDDGFRSIQVRGDLNLLDEIGDMLKAYVAYKREEKSRATHPAVGD